MNLDHRRQRKAEQRQKAMLAIILASVVCVASILSVFAYQFSGTQSEPTATASEISTNTSSATQPAPTAVMVMAVENTAEPPPTVAVTELAVLPGQEKLASMSLPEQIGQMLLVGVGGETITPVECQIIHDLAPGGIAFHGGNVANPQQLSVLIQDLKACADPSAPPMFFAIDHEGQYINRFESGVSIFPSALAQGALANPGLARQAAFASGQELSSMGINMILGPVADLLTNPDNLVIGERSFGSASQKVGGLVGLAVEGYRQAGMVTVLKHFPGHGGVSVDSHNSLPMDNAPLQTLSDVYLPPFQTGFSSGAQAVMLSHVVFPQMDPGGQPSSLSKPVMDFLRTQMGFEGVILTDDMNMGALQTLGQDVPSLSTKAVQAGVDMLIILPLLDARAAQQKIMEAVEHGEIPEGQIHASALRILNLKQQQGLLQAYPPPAEPDWQANANLAYSIGYQAITVMKNSDSLIPIPINIKSVFIIAPPDEWGLDAILGAGLQTRGLEFQFAHYNAPWFGRSGDDAMLRSFAAQAAGYDLVLLFTWQAHPNRLLYGDTWQGEMVNAIQQTGKSLIVVNLKSPTDVLEFPSIKNQIASFGTTAGQIQGLVDVLIGTVPPGGINPLPLLP